jgi:putative phage-type endonuclease
MTTWKEDEEFPSGLRHSPAVVGEFEVQSDEWLAARKLGLGASDTPSILGVPGAFGTSLKVWAQKIDNDYSENIDERTAELFYFGNRMEVIIAEELERHSGYEVRPEARTLAHPEEQFVQANLDGWALIDGVWGPAEFKNVSAWAADQWDEDVPLKYQVQIQHQMYVVGAEVAVAAALLGGNQFLWKTVERNDEFIEAMVRKLAEFWAMVENNVMPMAGDADLELIKAFNDTEPELADVLPFEALHWRDQIEASKEKLKKWKDFRRDAEAKVWQALGEAAIGELPDNSGQFYVTTNKHGTKTLRYREEK